MALTKQKKSGDSRYYDDSKKKNSEFPTYVPPPYLYAPLLLAQA